MSGRVHTAPVRRQTVGPVVQCVVTKVCLLADSRKKDLPAREPVCVVGRVRALSECFR